VNVQTPVRPDPNSSGANRLGIVEFIREFLEPDEGVNARKKLFGEDRLIQEIVCADLDATNLVLAIAQPGDHDDRDQPRLGIALPLSAEFVTALPRHDHVEKHQVRRIRMYDHVGFVGIWRGDNLVSASTQQLTHQKSVVLVVIHHENPCWTSWD